MRLLGERHWLKGMRLTVAVSLACVSLLSLAAEASAAVTIRYAQPGGVTTGACTSADPKCDLKYAVETAAAAGDEIVVTGGPYTISATILANSSKTIRGQGPARPLLRGAAGLTGPPLTINGGASVSHLRIESQNSQVALDLNGVGKDLELFSSGGNAAQVRGSSELNTAVAHTTAANATALVLSDGVLAGATVRHATVVATGAGSKGIDASGLNLLGIGAPSVVSSIVSGVTSDVTGGLLNTVQLSYSSYRPAASSGATSGAANVAAALLVDPATGNFQQQSASPTVNKGENADAATVDLPGNPRSIDGAPDIGAYELPVPPDASTGASSLITATSARLSGTVNPRSTSTTYHFDFGKTNPPASVTPDRAAGSGATATTYNEDLAALQPGTTYYYRVVATNTWGTTTGAVSSFSTPSVAPTSTTDPATLVTATSSRLNATVNPGGASTTAEFQWGLDTLYGTVTTNQALGSGANNVAMVADLSGLAPGTTYHYRVAANNVNGTVYGADQVFTTPTRAPIVTTPTSSAITTSSATLSGQVDPGGASTSWKFQYGVGNFGTDAVGTTLTGSTSQAVSKSLSGLLPGTTYDYRLVATNANGTVTSASGQFTTPVAAPTAITDAATGVRGDGATANGTTNPGGGSATVTFEYGTTAGYGQSTAPVGVSANTNALSVGVALSGLTPTTEYHYRIVVQNSAGIARGADATFITPAAKPDVATGDASAVARDSGQLAGTVNAGGADTVFEFEYGKTGSYGQKTAGATLLAGKVTESVTGTLAGLEAGATYHYRIVARNSAGTSVGADRTFKTQDPPKPDASGRPAGVPPTDGSPTRRVDGPVQADGLPAPDPVPPVGESANGVPSSGTVRVRLPGTKQFVRLTAAAGIPVGSTVDVTQGEITITSASDANGGTQTANFTGSEFTLLQRAGAQPITDIVLTGGSLDQCTPPMLGKVGDVMAAGRRKWSRRRLWGNGHGRFRTRGRHGTATVRGTWWLTEDRCDGTYFRVKRGLVEVRDLGLRKTVMVPAGDAYFAQAPAKKKRDQKR